ncbi:hypothetical protein C8R43DRAFT_1027304 [Mycena crocata]|nr:hypothetical protein C8R43DRAFT_1027304 [Mycena crocata]
MPTEAEIEALLSGVPIAVMQSTYKFEQADVLNSPLRGGDRSVQYVTTTDRSRDRTVLACKSGQDPILDWRNTTFEISGCKRPIGALKRRKSSSSSSRYWIYSPTEEFKVRYDDKIWTVLSSNGSQVATMTLHVSRIFSDSSPAVLHISPELRDEDERRFIILVLLYSETRRLDREQS